MRRVLAIWNFSQNLAIERKSRTLGVPYNEVRLYGYDDTHGGH